MRTRRRVASLAARGLLAPAAQALDFTLGPVNAELLLAAGVQGAHFRDPRTSVADEDGNYQASARLDLEWITDDGLTLGLRAEVDEGNRASEELARDELYVYAAGTWGRVELGEQDGPADVMSFHAPVVALGQVRGDFARYAGSVASLSATDTGDAAKLVYLSPPIGGLRFGAAYAPEYAVNEDDPDPRRRLVQEDAVELGAQYEAPLPGEWMLGASVAHVRGAADPATTRRDLESWSAGVQLRREGFVAGGAYVDNGDSNDLVVNDEREWNAGVAWRMPTWGVGASYARMDSRLLDNRLIGIGGYRNVGERVVIRADAVHVEEERPTRRGSGYVLLLEFAVQL